jgi:hypothetical protein
MNRRCIRLLAAAALVVPFVPAADARHHRRAAGGDMPADASGREVSGREVGGREVSGRGACRNGLSGGSPQVELRHIFCGEINRGGKAVGFHSRPGGVNPETVSGTREGRPVRGHPGLYNLTRFQITQNGETATKGISTLYPDKCSASDVIAAVQYAYNNGEVHGQQFRGMSGPSCTGDDGQPFPIMGFTGGRGGARIRTGYPNVGGGDGR